ncbi:MAG: hypothetical protein IKV41_05615 [Oscillospiraceae bacterium]|nr:hypothetical protein [Oscillospiraceae bacterium]
MRVSSSTVKMSATRSFSAETTQTQTTILRQHDGNSITKQIAHSVDRWTSDFEVEGSTAVYTTSENDVVKTQQQEHNYTNTRENADNPSQPSNPNAAVLPSMDTPDWLDSLDKIEESPEIKMLKTMLKLLERFSKKKFSDSCFEIPSQLKASCDKTTSQTSFAAASAKYKHTVSMFAKSGVSLAVQRTNNAVNGVWTRQVISSGFVSEHENTAFCSKGTVITSDGRSIDFNISMEMSRSFEGAFAEVGKEEIYTDPLIINLDTDCTSLSDVSFYFDLNCDGVKEEISAPNDSSGFLALDKNNDGIINNGSELFGTKTGDGFAELAQYDKDGNGWIDENDDIFSQLSVWVKCGSGSARCLSLKQANVGAVFLGRQNTLHSLDTSDGETNAILRSTGIYIKENGQVGTVQHVDFKT